RSAAEWPQNACILTDCKGELQPGANVVRRRSGERRATTVAGRPQGLTGLCSSQLTVENPMSHDQGTHELETRLAESWPAREWCGSHVVLGVSGGPDSVALLRAMVALKDSA